MRVLREAGIGAGDDVIIRATGRSRRSLRLPDALSLATALASDAELLSFDDALRRIATQAASES